MLFQRKHCLMLAFFTYFILILLFFTLREKQTGPSCDSRIGCLRLCCDNLETCDESFKNTFIESFGGHWSTAVSEGKFNGTPEDMLVLKSRPMCKLNLISGDKWKFDAVSFIPDKFLII